ncbi:D-alanyl-D-alanine carboxypeptidase [Pandoraea thiooxydans]|uniref:serine-type D-Ala-D-Ala carboxypeptidase n=1 Tax=Pandoraea thiooxydans TaxID=445709 RepID=A0A0G3EV68_9BURK|nr:D-alanyl-D-alanine carboxypeptidase family protein [Pandoraea thiooxydans]AKJ69272.1 peptidase [Pandoraea thiooxydans]APR96882.1 D-alanyl-D-alanine carboxypeptidase [Pandoraea thiooxydans]
MNISTAFSRVACVATLVAVSLTAQAQVPPPPMSAKAWLISDLTSGQLLAQGNPDKRIPPASLAKLMTSYLVFEALKNKSISMDQTVRPSESVRSVGADESRTFIEAGKPISVHDLVYGMIVQSGNDATIALAELIGGSQANFVNMMNHEAKRLGLKNTHYVNVDGLPDPQNYTTVADLAILSARLIEDFPEYYPIYAVKSFTYNHIRQWNRNRLLFLDPTVDGLKTGHTEEAGYCLIASAHRPMPNVPGVDRRVLAIAVGNTTERARVQDTLSALNYAYQSFDTLRVYGAGQVIAKPRIWKGRANTVEIGVDKDTFVTLPKGLGDKIKPVLEVRAPLIAPLAKGAVVGTVNITADGKQVAAFPVVALQDVPQAGILGRAWDALRLKFLKK